MRQVLQNKELSRLGVSVVVEWVEIHMRLHTEDDPYKCTYKGCNRTFSSPKSLKHHEAVWHNAAGNEPTIEHNLREKILRLQNRYRVFHCMRVDA